MPIRWLTVEVTVNADLVDEAMRLSAEQDALLTAMDRGTASREAVARLSAINERQRAINGTLAAAVLDAAERAHSHPTPT